MRLVYVPQKQSGVQTKFPTIHTHRCLTSIAWEHGCYEGESNENLKKCDKNSKHSSIVFKLTTVILMF